MEDAYSTQDKKPKGSASLAAVVSAFVPTWVTGVAFVAIFILIRRHYPKTYYPRTHVGTIPKRQVRFRSPTIPLTPSV
jgi:hypothetical protein